MSLKQIVQIAFRFLLYLSCTERTSQRYICYNELRMTTVTPTVQLAQSEHLITGEVFGEMELGSAELIRYHMPAERVNSS